ncbi:ParA family protein [Parvularcula sp. LCG005]|uniref:ParA family protein n=1 Tax=Parvularcula sp. LCG005 TaxID=3078805 RepID=UPI002941C501|nr:ParA family protein [Parvularcula sp. LCG005]WOI53302.1 ParA family protein [Parvularcula sp. LCG005]
MNTPQYRTLAVANQKGGVGKTTTTINLGTALAAVGERVLIVDLDPQGNASTGLGVPSSEREYTTYDVLRREAALIDTEKATPVPRLTIAPSGMDLAGAEIELLDVANRHYRLRDAIAEYAAQVPDLTYVLIDCPPSLGLLTVNAMAASHAVLIPLQCEFFALEGLAQIMRTIDQVRDRLNPQLELQGIILTMYDGRNNLSRDVEDSVRSHMGDKVYKTAIPRNVRISEAPSHGKPALLYDLKCAGSQAYVRLATEVIQRERAA